MIPLDYSVRERDSELAVRAEVIAKAWLKMQEKDPLGHLHEQVACEKVNLQLAELAKTALRTLIGEMERGTEATIFVKPPMPCDNIKVEFEPHRGEAQSAGPMDDKGTGLVIVTYRPQDFPQGASEDSSSGDGPDYKGEGDSSCSMSPAPPKLGFWRWLTDWALGRKQEDAAGSGKIIPSCGPPPPFRLESDPVIPRSVGMPKEFAAPYGVDVAAPGSSDKSVTIADALDRIDRDWRDKMQKSVDKYVSADDPLVAELLARGAAEAWDLIDQATKESGGQLPAILPTGHTNEQLAEVGRGAVQWAKLIEEKDGMSLVNARLLHAELEVGKDFSNWIKDCIRDHKFVEHEHYTVFARIGENPKGGRPSIDYHLDPESAKHIAAASTTEAGRDIRSYLIECERQLRTGPREPVVGLPLPKLHHISTQKERVAALPVMGQLLIELGKSLAEGEKLKEEFPMLPDDPEQKLTAAEAYIAGLNEMLTKIEKERDQLLKQVDPDAEEVMSRQAHDLVEADKRIAELEARVAAKQKLEAEAPPADPYGPKSKLTAEREKVDKLEVELTTMKATADKLTELVTERERLFDQVQMKLVEAEREKEVLISRIEAPTRGTNLTDFFKETASFLGYTDALGHEYLVSVAKILFRKPNEAGDLCYLPTAEFDRNGWFHVMPSVYTKPEAVDGVKTGKRFKVKTWMLYLTPDQPRPDGSVYKIGGYTWLKQHMMKAELTTLQRLIVETGGPRGEFKRLDGYILSKVHDDSLPGLESTGEEVITIAKGTGDGELKKGAWVAGCRTESGTEQATGLTLRDALVTNAHGPSW